MEEYPFTHDLMHVYIQMSTGREHGKTEIKGQQCLLTGPGSETIVISDFWRLVCINTCPVYRYA